MASELPETVQIDVPTFDPADQIFQEAFREVDKDHNGTLDKKEFRQFMVQARQEKLSKYIFNIIDKDHNGKVSLEEFQEFGRAMYAVVTKQDLRLYMKMIFDACDTDKKNQLTMKQFLNFMKYTGNPVGYFQRKKQFKNWDEDGNGYVDFEEIMSRIHFVMAHGAK